MFNNRLVQILIGALIVFGICWLAKINFGVQAGSNGIHVNLDRGTN